MKPPKFYLVSEDDFAKGDIAPMAYMNISLLELAYKHMFEIENWGSDSVGQELGQRFQLPDGRQFIIEFFVHADKNARNALFANISKGYGRKDLLDILDALEIPETALTWVHDSLQAQPFSAKTAAPSP